MNFAKMTGKLDRVYKYQGSKKAEFRALVALNDANSELSPGELAIFDAGGRGIAPGYRG